MAKVLTINSLVTCAHKGRISLKSSTKLTVNRKPVLVKSAIDRQTIMNCTTVLKVDPAGPIDLPCNSVSATPLPAPPSMSGVTTGEARKLTVGGEPVMLDTLAGQTNGMVGKVAPQPGLSAVAQHNKLVAI